MKRIAAIVEDFFEDVEYSKPVEAFKKAGYEVVNIGLRKGETVTGKKENTQVKINRSVDDASVTDYDALFIPGGYSPDKLRGSKEAVRFARDFVKSGKPVLAICHAPQLLITADVVRGRRMTGWKTIEVDLKNAGAEYHDEEVVVDDNLVSSRGPRDIPAFIKASFDKLESQEGKRP